MVEKFLKRSSWIDIIISIIFIFFGGLLALKPEETLGAISIILGITIIAMGVLKLIEYFSSEVKEDYLLTFALVLVIFGVVVLFANNSIIAFFRVLLGIWVLVDGIMDLETALAWKDTKSPYWLTSLVLSIFMMFAGLLILVNQNIVLTTMGILIIVYGIFDIVDRIIFMKKIKDFEK